MSRQTLLGRHQADIGRCGGERLTVIADDRRPLEKVIRTESVRKPGRAARGEDVGRTRNIVADGDRRLVAQKDGTGILDLRQDLVRIGR